LPKVGPLKVGVQRWAQMLAVDTQAVLIVVGHNASHSRFAN